MKVQAGWADVTIGGGVESMTYVPMGGSIPRPHPTFAKTQSELYISMGLTAENVANRYNVTREQQDEFAALSQQKAAAARANKWFTEIVPTPAARFVQEKNGTFRKETFIQDHDDGIRDSTTVEGLAKLRPAFSADRLCNGRQLIADDGRGCRHHPGQRRKSPGTGSASRWQNFSAIRPQDADPDEMGVGPLVAIPKLLKLAGLEISDIGLFEINEAFASQAIYCTRELGIDMDKVNIHGGAIALGHPLGCTGAKLCATLLTNMRKRVPATAWNPCVSAGAWVLPRCSSYANKISCRNFMRRGVAAF